eukprot:Hpha_TRINITY_DN15805_c0_g3::TRINITY_DN15805_c0_g3_i1::g.190162::m.190162
MSGFDDDEKKAIKGVDMEKQAGRRREAAVTLRQKTKDALLREKRGRIEPSEPGQPGHFDPVAAMQGFPQPAPMFNADFQTLTAQLASPDPAQALESASTIRRMLSREHNPPIDEVIQAGCVPLLVAHLGRHDQPRLQFESEWALTNIASGTTEQCQVVIHAEACPRFVELTGSMDPDVKEQAVWAIGNIAGDSAVYRDLMIGLGALPRLIGIISMNPGVTLLRCATWAMSNCLRSKPIPELTSVRAALPVATQLLRQTDDAVLIDAAWALSYASDGPNDRIEAVLACQPLPALMELLKREQQTLLTPALRTIGNIVTGTTPQTQAVLEAGVLPVIGNLMSHPVKAIRKECSWFLSNVTAGTRDQIQLIIQSGLLAPLVEALGAAEWEVRKESTWAITNLTFQGTIEQIHAVVMAGCLEPLLDQLSVSDPKIITVALEALQNIIRAGENVAASRQCPNMYKIRLVELGASEKIERLQHHECDDVYRKALAILEEFFEGEEADPDDMWAQVQQLSAAQGVAAPADAAAYAAQAAAAAQAQAQAQGAAPGAQPGWYPQGTPQQ